MVETKPVRIAGAGPGAEPPDRHAWTDALGDRPGLVPVRPDSDVGFLGDESAAAGLAEYLRRWLPGGQ